MSLILFKKSNPSIAAGSARLREVLVEHGHQGRQLRLLDGVAGKHLFRCLEETMMAPLTLIKIAGFLMYQPSDSHYLPVKLIFELSRFKSNKERPTRLPKIFSNQQQASVNEQTFSFVP